VNTELAVLRILHILAGVFWAGAAVYLALVLEPKLRQAGDEIEGAVLRQVSRLNSLWITLSAIVTIAAGFVLIARTPGHSFDQLFTNGWGTAIGIGLIASLAAFFLSGWVGANTAKLRRALAGEVSVASDAAAIASYRSRISLGSKVNAALVVIAVGTMAAARYV
jgi:uncharacterized membrane protein